MKITILQEYDATDQRVTRLDVCCFGWRKVSKWLTLWNIIKELFRK